MLSPALPVVWTMLFSRIVGRRTRNSQANPRKMVRESTATGMLALTVTPTLSTRYMLLAPNTTPRNPPIKSGITVNSGGDWSAGMNGLCSVSGRGTGLAMWAPDLAQMRYTWARGRPQAGVPQRAHRSPPRRDPAGEGSDGGSGQSREGRAGQDLRLPAAQGDQADRDVPPQRGEVPGVPQGGARR